MYVLIKSFILGLILTAFIATTQIAKAEVKLDSCWKMYFPNEPEKGFLNPDSVMVDTCLSGSSIFPYTPHEILLAKRWFSTILPIHALDIPVARHDTIIERNWRDIDTNFKNLRNGFADLEIKFGEFKLYKTQPENDDTNSYGSRSFRIKFNNYIVIDSVIFYLRKITVLIFPNYEYRNMIIDNILNFSEIDTCKILIYPNPISDLFFIKNLNFKQKLIITLLNENLYDLKKIKIFNETYNDYIFDLHDFSNGIYYLKIEVDKKTIFEKIIKIN